MKKLLVALITLSLTCAFAFAGEPEQNFVKQYESKKGTVTFNHEAHSTYGDCEACHNLFSVEGVNRNTGHKACKSCHKGQLDEYPNAPVACTGCHVR